MPRFKLIYLFWAMSLFAAALATFGTWGIAFTIGAFAFWLAIGLSVTGRISVDTLEIVVLVVGCIAVFSLLRPAITNTHAPSRRSMCSNNLRWIQLGILNYEAANNCFPPPYITDENGKPMHSWRVLILPYLEEKELYDKYNFNEPWDSPANLKLLEETPEVYECPSREDSDCHYLAVTGEDSVWRVGEPVKMREVSHGTSKCVMLTETPKGVPWTKPEDTTPEEFLKLAVERGQIKGIGGHITTENGAITGQRVATSYVDGHIKFLQIPQQAHWLESLSCRHGNFDLDRLEERYFEPKLNPQTSIPGWLLFALSLIPSIPMTKWYLARKKSGVGKKRPAQVG